MTILRPITTDGCGCDQRDTVKKLISIDQALMMIADRAKAVGETEEILLAHALDRVLAHPVKASCMAPPFDNAAMDGYAVDTAAMQGDGPWTLDVVARVPAGARAMLPLSGMLAARIFTGAPIPAGSDAVVMQEDVQRHSASVHLRRRPSHGLNIRRAGSEMAAGAEILGADVILGPREIAACAAAGTGVIQVRRRLRVALLVTGNEVRRVSENRSDAEIWDVNTPMMTAALTQPGIDLVSVEQGIDSLDGLYLQIAEMAHGADLVITTGGISVGEEDHVKPALQKLGTDIVFSGVAIKPGKPVSFGCINGVHWLGLPGNPLSAFVTWQLFGTALVRRLTGQIGVADKRRYVVTSQVIFRKAGRCELRAASCIGFDPQGREVVTCDDATHSSQVRGLPAASGLIFLPADTDHLPAGALVEFQPFCR